jgi:hypothetical protein
MTGSATATPGILLQADCSQQQKGHLDQAPACHAQVPEIDRRNYEALRRDDPSEVGSLSGLSGVCELKACRLEGGWTVFRSR